MAGRLRSRGRRIGLWAGTLAIVSMLSACAYWRVWSYDDFRVYRQISYHSPVAHALWHGSIREGDRIDRVIALSRPNHLRAVGPFLSISYFPSGDLSPGSISLEGTTLTAKDGRLIFAASYGCTFERIHFDIMTAEEESLLKRLLEGRFEAELQAAD